MSTSAPRHSLYPATAHLAPSYGAPQQSASLSSLASCVASVELSCQTLESSVAMLQSATADMPRLAKVLASKRHFDLVSERDIRSAREHLSAEIAPQLRELIPLAEQALEREEKVVKSLKSKHQQITARQAQLTSLHAPARVSLKARPAQSDGPDLESTRRKVEELRRRKEILQKRVEKLETEVEREETEASLLAASSKVRTSN